jgi:hypothetical protein
MMGIGANSLNTAVIDIVHILPKLAIDNDDGTTFQVFIPIRTKLNEPAFI